MLQRLNPERRTNLLLMLGFFVSLVLYCVFLGIEETQNVGWSIYLVFSFLGVPFLLLQCRLCRAEHCRWARWIPLVLTGAAAGIGALFFFRVLGSGWDSLDGFLLMVSCIAPSVGIALGWIAAGSTAERAIGAVWMFLFAVCYIIKVVFFGFDGLLDGMALLYVLLGIGLFFLSDWKGEAVHAVPGV